MTLPSKASNSSTLCGTSGVVLGHLAGHLLEQAVRRLLDRVLRRGRDALAGLAGEVERITGRLAHRPPLDDPQADRAVFSDHPARIVIRPAGGDADDIEVQLGPEIRRDAGDRRHRAMDHGEVQPLAKHLVGALLGGSRGVLQGHLGADDRRNRLVVNRLLVASSVFQR